MLPGPDQVIACPHCRALERYGTLMSGNTFGAVLWTDGKEIAPMLPRPPAVARCHDCGRPYWLAKAREVGQVSVWGEPDEERNPQWAEAPGVTEPSAAEYHAAIAAGFATTFDEEKELRILAWWRGNDAARGDPCDAEAISDPVPAAVTRENLERLARMLGGPSEGDQIMRAEVLRELGQSDAALHVLAAITAPEVQWTVGQLRALCEARDPTLRRLETDGEAE
jgi:hypothetical protein